MSAPPQPPPPSIDCETDHDLFDEIKHEEEEEVEENGDFYDEIEQEEGEQDVKEEQTEKLLNKEEKKEFKDIERIRKRPLLNVYHESSEAKRKKGKSGLTNNNGICPPHPGFFSGICIRCCARKSDSDSHDQSGIPLSYFHPDFELTATGAARFRQDHLDSIHETRKLYLVLDLDHTLVNSARFSDVQPEEEAYVTKTYFEGVFNPDGDNNNQRSLHRLTKMYLWTKLRPYVTKFLEQASRLYEIHIYTMGERVYGLKMAELLDPGKKYFKSVISKNDSTRAYEKDLDVVLGDESAVVIVDDCEHVWPKHKANLLEIQRYSFFESSCRELDWFGRSWTQKKSDESENEGALTNVLRVLKSVHRTYFDVKRNGCRDVREILKDLRFKVLKGCRIVFSRVFRSGDMHHLWDLAEELGAKCSAKLDERVTHVVGLEIGTQKARWALENNRHLVHPRWLHAAKYSWQRPDEVNFPVLK